MGMPQIPEGIHRPNLEELIIDLLESIALEEMAISHILNAEGEKLQAVICSYKNKDINICDLATISSTTHKTISDLVIKEWLLLNKFNNIQKFSCSLKNNYDICEVCNSCTTNDCNCKCNKFN